MADLVMGAMGSLIPKLGELLKEEYSLQTGVKERISFLTKELEVAQAALCKVAQVPWDQLDKQVQLWAREVREASYDMEDVLDAFLVRVQGPDSTEQEEGLLKLLKKMSNLFKASKARRKISGDVKDIMNHLQDVTERCGRYKVDDIVARPNTASTIDPRLHAMYNKVKNLVGINKSSYELISMLQPPLRDDASNMKMKIVSIVGVGGLGKTTLAKAVYDEIKGDFHCGAFVPVGQNPDLKKVLKDILIDLDRRRCLKFSTAVLDERQLIDQLRSFLENKRYFIVIDDVWEIPSWELIKLAIGDDNNCGARIIITTRKLKVATEAEEVYKLRPLSDDMSRELFFTRIYGHEGQSVDNKADKITVKLLKKCAGIPLAIITMGSLLVGKPRETWSEIYKSIGFGFKENEEAGNTMRILSYSYYDLPAHLRTCLLYFSSFPEDSFIDKGSLVWKWVAEGFVHKEDGISLFETGEGYFNDLINRSMIQAVESTSLSKKEAVESAYNEGIITGCRVHDIVLDFIHFISREELFFTVLDHNRDTLLQSNVRWLANHNGNPHQCNHFEMPKLRSYIALGCVIETWAPHSSFTHLRVLAIEHCRTRSWYGISRVRVEHIGHLRHLRFLSLSGTPVGIIPKEIGALRFLQTVDLSESGISEMPSTSSLPKQLACLRISLNRDALNGSVFSVEGMTSLEELSIDASIHEIEEMEGINQRWSVKDLGCLRELRVLHVLCNDEETKTGLLESLPHLDKLQSLVIDCAYCRRPMTLFPKWQPRELALSRHLRHLAVDIKFRKLPSCINPACVPNLSHLDLFLKHIDEQDLRNLGGLPELRFLRLVLWSSSAAISNISDSNAGYFPKLRCCRLPESVVLFAGNKEDKSISFHIWNGHDDIGVMPSVSDDEWRQSPRPSVSGDELRSEEGMQLNSPMPRSVSDNHELHRRPIQHWTLQHGLAALACYLLALFLDVLAFLKRWSLKKKDQYRPIPSRASEAQNKGSICSCSDSQGAAAPPCFMPSLQVLHFTVGFGATQDPRCCNKLGLEYLSSLREINVDLWGVHHDNDKKEALEAALRRAARVHPNRPTLHIGRF